VRSSLAWFLALLAAACSGTATAPAPVTAIAVEGGDGQFGVPGFLLADPLEVRVVDTDGVPVVGARVTWTAADRDASVTPNASFTDAAGVARAAWRLGRDDGTQTATATFQALGAARFTAEARSGAATHASGTAQHQCGRFSDDTVRCWSSPDGEPARLVALDTDIRFTALAYALGTWCGGTRTGAVACVDLEDMLPGGEFRPEAAPVRLEATGTPLFIAIAGGGDPEDGTTWCAIANDSRLWCWGRNESGQLGIGMQGAPIDQPTPVVGAFKATRVAVTDGATCALDLNGAAFCWGRVDDGVVDASQDQPSPVAVPTPRRFAQLAMSGSGTACALAPDFLVYCWGSDATGGRGRGGAPDSPVPEPIAGTDLYVSLGATEEGFLAVTVDRDLVVWGDFRAQPVAALPLRVLPGFVFRDVLPGGGSQVICLRAYPVGTRCLDRDGIARAVTVGGTPARIFGVPST
jgi:hypothetical protein